MGFRNQLITGGAHIAWTLLNQVMIQLGYLEGLTWYERYPKVDVSVTKLLFCWWKKRQSPVLLVGCISTPIYPTAGDIFSTGYIQKCRL